MPALASRSSAFVLSACAPSREESKRPGSITRSLPRLSRSPIAVARVLPCGRRRIQFLDALLNVLHRVTDALDPFGFLIGDLRPEFLLETHDELDEVERVRVEVVYEGCFHRHVALVDAELLDDDLLQLVEDLLLGRRQAVTSYPARWGEVAVVS